MMNHLARTFLNAAGLYLGLAAPHPRQLGSLTELGALPRRSGMPSAFRRH
jgi:hypothetical protein